jgi:hypothetical protein
VNISEIIDRFEIKEALHFTTNLGLLGILDSGKVRSRKRLKNDNRLDFILKLNTPIVRDPAWVDYVNLSLTRINSNLFEISSEKWHSGNRELWWCVLSFDTCILAHEGVFFTTTNNIYPSAKRRQGPEGLESLFAPVVLGKYGAEIRRTNEITCACPTCEQAEVLYPGELSTRFLKKIYVATDEDQDDVYGQLSGVRHPNIPVIINPGIFRGSSA